MKVYKLIYGLLLYFCLLITAGPVTFAADKFILEGAVWDASTGEPVPYANISVKNTANGSITDANGNFTLNLEKKDSVTLIVSHIAYKKQSLNVVFSDIEQPLKINLPPKDNQLPDLVVSASLYEEPLNRLSKSALIISNRDIRENMMSNMTDMLASTPGFTQVWEYHSPLLLRGMNSKRLVIMKNGSRRIGTFPGGYFGQDMNIYDAGKVEIIKGPGSVIYGSGAISGIINIVSPPLTGSNKTNFKVMSGFGRNNEEFLETARFCLQKKNYGIGVNAKFRTSSDIILSSVLI